ncbi:cobalt-precorrin 5A hydrolase [Roseiarcus fermentans]|uniref:Cobalt-precorrin 5A hydrolase n=1 Tax=Roseiarcus fermentans TaxID=1473586 RepID=A0A366FEY9_9HYPH|nr:cobalamin biosynthesis protein [Roseiarcus fermentans]RBP13171.1 cobalt-precorrin 5A hydrolase [Roseiarcus fermentans]
MNPRVAIGVGCRSNAGAETLVAVIRDATARSPAGSTVVSLHSSARKAGDADLLEAAGRRGLDLILHDEAALRARDAEIPSRSARVIGIAGVGSLAEAAALVGAGEGSRFVVRKFSASGVSCAVAVAAESKS